MKKSKMIKIIEEVIEAYDFENDKDLKKLASEILLQQELAGMKPPWEPKSNKRPNRFEWLPEE